METQASHINAGAGGVSDQDRTASQRKHCGHPPPVCWTGSGKGLGVLLRAETACLQKPERHRTNCSAHNLPAECAGGHQWTGRLRTQGLPPVSLYCLLLSVLLSRVRLFATPWTAARQASTSITNSRSLLELMSIQPSHPLSSPSPPAFNLSQHQSLFQ